MRHAKELKRKSEAHTVTRIDRRWFDVTDANSGHLHHVHLRGDQTLECDCAWARKRHHDDNAVACSHAIAVQRFIKAEEDQRTISAWASPEDAARQHRSVINLNDGVWLTTRLAEGAL